MFGHLVRDIRQILKNCFIYREKTFPAQKFCCQRLDISDTMVQILNRY